MVESMDSRGLGSNRTYHDTVGESQELGHGAVGMEQSPELPGLGRTKNPSPKDEDWI